MDTPGFDPVSVTGIVAGGATVACFTPGRGSVFGCRPTPSIKLATNTQMYQRMAGDMGINCALTCERRCTPRRPGWWRVLRAAGRQAGAGPLTRVPCDNLRNNGAVVARVLGDFAELADPKLAGWIGANVAYVTTMVDRITPVPTAGDIAGAEAQTGVRARAAVVTEPFSEWVIRS